MRTNNLNNRLDQLLAELALSLKKNVLLKDVEVDESLLIKLNEGSLEPELRRTVIAALLQDEGLYQRWIDFVELNEVEASIPLDDSKQKETILDMLVAWIKGHLDRLIWSGAVLVPIFALFVVNLGTNPQEYIDRNRLELVTNLNNIQIVAIRGNVRGGIDTENADRTKIMKNTSFVQGMFYTINDLDSDGKLLEKWVNYTKINKPDFTEISDYDSSFNVGQIVAAISLLCLQKNINSVAIQEGDQLVSKILSSNSTAQGLDYFISKDEYSVSEICIKYEKVLKAP